MKRQSDDIQSLVYAYGCSEPTGGIEHLQSEHALQRAMWDALVRADRTAERALWESARQDPDIDALVTSIDVLSEQISAAVKERRAKRATARAKIDTPDLDARIDALSADRQGAKARLWPRLSAWRKLNATTVRAIEQTRRDESKTIRQRSGLYWCNYNRVIDSFERGRKLAKKRGGQMRFSDPARADGVLTVQIQKTTSGLGASMAELLS